MAFRGIDRGPLLTLVVVLIAASCAGRDPDLTIPEWTGSSGVPEPAGEPRVAVMASEPEAGRAEAAPDAAFTPPEGRDPFPRGLPYNQLLDRVDFLENYRACSGSAAAGDYSCSRVPLTPRLIFELASSYRLLARSLAQGDRAFEDKTKRLIGVARRNSVKNYNILISTDADFCMDDDHDEPLLRHCTDEALYYIGLQQQELGETQKAQAAFGKLVLDHKDSPWRPYAYYGFGAATVDAAQNESDPSKRSELYGFAETSFTGALIPASGVTGMALLELGNVRELQGDRKGALDAFHQLQLTHTSSRASARIPDWARLGK